MMRFSQRIGKTPAFKDLQIESIDIELRNGLWNVTKTFIFDILQRRSTYGSGNQFAFFCNELWHLHYKDAIDTILSYDSDREQFIRNKFFRKLFSKPH